MSALLRTRRQARVAGDREDLLAKIRALAISRYAGSAAPTMKKFFLTYDRDGNQCLDKGELARLVKESGFSLWYASDGMVAQGIIDEMDRNPRKGCVSWADYRRSTGLPEDAPPPPVAAPVVAPPPAAKSTLSSSVVSIAVEPGAATAVAPVRPMKSAPSALIGGAMVGLGVLALAFAR